MQALGPPQVVENESTLRMWQICFFDAIETAIFVENITNFFVSILIFISKWNNSAYRLGKTVQSSRNAQVLFL